MKVITRVVQVDPQEIFEEFGDHFYTNPSSVGKDPCMAGPKEDPSARLLAAHCVGNVTFHVDAIRMRINELGEQLPDSDDEEILDLHQRMFQLNDQAWQLMYFAGIPYGVFFYPYGI